MSGNRKVTIDRLTLRLPRHAARNPTAILKEVSRVLGEQATASQERMRVVSGPSPQAEGGEALARRIGRATAARLQRGGGHGD